MNIENLKLTLYKKIDTKIKNAILNNQDCSDFRFLSISSEERNILKSCLDMNDHLMFGEIIFSKIKILEEKDIESYYSKY